MIFNSIRLFIYKYFRYGLTLLSPKLNTKVVYFFKFRKRLNLNHPETLNEKILWCKYNKYWNNGLVQQCADKYKVRDYIKEKECSEILIPLIDVYENVSDIEWESLPNNFALKWNYGCGYNIICTNKEDLDIKLAKKKLSKWHKEHPWLGYAEMQYKIPQKRIIVEKCLPIIDGKFPCDYKFFCLNGKCYFIMLCTERDVTGHAFYYFFTPEWTALSEDTVNCTIPKPFVLPEAIGYAEKLASDFPFVRVDLYIVKEKIYFGEMTFTPAGGMDKDYLKTVVGSNRTIDDVYGEKFNINDI